MSRAVYAKLWMATSQYHLRRQYGWTQVWKRLAPWSALYGAVGLWLFFPALSYDTKKMITFGVWNPPDVGYGKFQAKPES